MTNYFKCRPNVHCDGVPCCTHFNSIPDFSVADYLRIAADIGVTPVDLWMKHGAVRVEDHHRSALTEIEILLSFAHEPCPLLTEEYSCQVYPVRPLVCAGFPLAPLTLGGEHLAKYASYGCINGKQPHPDQLKLLVQMVGIGDAEKEIANEFFWDESPPTYSFAETGGMEFIQLARSRQMARDQTGESSESVTVESVATTLFNALTVQKITTDDLQKLGAILALAIHKDDIAKRFDALPDEAIRRFEESTRQWKELLSQM